MLSTGSLLGALGFYEPEAARILKLPRNRSVGLGTGSCMDAWICVSGVAAEVWCVWGGGGGGRGGDIHW
jgi:hypothetical protein